jgi:acyl-CoA thioesterase FadM
MLTPRLRALAVVARGLAGPKELVSRLPLRVWPTDVDLNVHLTNSRYAALMDLGRLDLLLRSGVARSMFLTDARPIAVEVRLRFAKELRLGQRFTLETRVVGRERKAVVVEQRFLVGDEVHAVGTVSLVLLRRGKVIEPRLLAPLLEAASG